jgi:hypothetical protein
MADWRQLYTAAVLETDPTRLMMVITETEEAMEIRLRELSREDKERQEIANAATALALLKVERESWKQEPLV